MTEYQPLSCLAKTLSITLGPINTILTKYLMMKKLKVRWVARMFTEKKVDVSREHESLYPEDRLTFMQRIVMQDETWIHHLHS